MKQRFLNGLILFSLALPACKPHTGEQEQAEPVAKTDSVLQKLEEDISKYPDSVKLYNAIADTLVNRRQFAEAAKWFDKLIRRGDRQNYYYWFLKGDAFRRGQLYDSAIVAYRTYLLEFPDDEQVLLNLANTYAEAGNKNALDLANLIAARYPNREMRSEAAFIKGVYYNTVRDYENARRWLDTTILLNYTFSEAYMEKGYALYDQGKYKLALQSFQRLATINNGYADAWYWMAKSQEALGLYKEAVNNYESAYALDRTLTEALAAIERLKHTATFRQDLR